MLSIDSIQLEANETALVVIDIQEKLLAAMPKDIAANLVKNTSILLHTANEFNMPIIMTEQYPKGLGQTVPEIKELTKGITSIEKMSFSCCGDNNFLKAIDDTKAQNLILCGMETHICVYQTAADLLRTGFQVNVVADAVSSRTLENKQFALEKMAAKGANLCTVEMLLFELLKTAEHPRFREIAKLIK